MQQADIDQSPLGKRIGQGATLVGIVSFFAVTLSVPYFYPTETLWYKVGSDKVMLQVGQFAGLVTMGGVVLQILLALRPSFMRRAFGAANLIGWHRKNGLLLAFTAVSHVILVLAPEGFSNLPIGWRFWPELLGAVSLFTLLCTVVLSHYRSRLKLNYKRWRMVHRPLGYLLILLLALHALFVSESFAAVMPRIVLLLVIISLLFGAVIQWFRSGRKNMPVEKTL